MIVSDCTVLRESVWLADLEAITDPHVRSDGALAGKVDTARMFVQGIAHLVSLEPRPDVVLMTGDLVDEGSESEYRVLRDILTPLDIPLYMIPGNHDDRDALRTVFSDLTYLFEGGPFINYLVEDFPLRLVALDSVVPGRGSGSLCEARLAWLDARLAEDTSRPTVIIMHHPPFETGIGHMDAVSLGNKEALAEVVARYSNVERILCGHVHRPIYVRFAGTIASTAPSNAHQIPLDLRPDAPSVFVMEPPACMIHTWIEGTGLVSHISYIGDYDGPRPFRPGQVGDV